jgi:hypothetical protein
MVRRATALMLLALAAPAGAAVPRVGAGAELPVAVGPGDQLEPTVKGQTVAYTDYASSVPHVFLWTETTQSSTAVTGGSGSQVSPSLSNERLVYTDSAFNDDVRAYVLATQSYSTPDAFPAAQTFPTVSSEFVAWEDARSGDLRIRVHDLFVDSGSFDISGPGTYRRPRADQDLIVYIDQTAGSAVKLWQSGAGNSVVFAGPAGSADVDAAARVIALSLQGPGGDQDIAVYTTGGQQSALLPLQGEQRNPHISGDWVAFEDLATGASRVVLWNWKTGDLMIPVVGSSEQRLGSIDWPRVVYADNRSGSFDVFLYDDSAPAPAPDGGIDGGADGGADGGPVDECDERDDCDCREDCEGQKDCHDEDRDCHHHHHCHRHCRHPCLDRGNDGSVDGKGGDGSIRDDGGRAVCDDPGLPVLAQLRIETDRSGPNADDTGFDSPQSESAVICIDSEHVASAWVAFNRLAVATPNDFDPNVTRAQARCEVRTGWNSLGGIVAGKPGSWLQIRVVADGRGTADGEQPDGGCGIDSDPAGPQAGHGPAPQALGCATTRAGLALPLLALLGALLLARRARAR